MNSMTMHILGALVDAAMNSTTFGCRNAVITRTYTAITIISPIRSAQASLICYVCEQRTSSLKDFSMSLVIFSEAMTLTATSVPFHVALCTSP